MINRYKLVSRHNPKLNVIDLSSPLSVGNGDFAYTADITGLQTLYSEYKERNVPLCTMSNWGWHITPVGDEIYAYTMNDLMMTEYEYAGHKVTYAVEEKVGNEEVYNWLRRNPHRINLGRIGFKWDGKDIHINELSDINQELKLYEGVIESQFRIHGVSCKVLTVCDYRQDILGFCIESPALEDGRLGVQMSFPYGASDITGSDWNSDERHSTIIKQSRDSCFVVERTLDKTLYYVGVNSEDSINVKKSGTHKIDIKTFSNKKLNFTVTFSDTNSQNFKTISEVRKSSQVGWKSFWQTGGAIELYKSKDPRALELERRIVQSQYLLAIQSSGSIPPQETGLTCNSWYGKFHLEMHLWHAAYLPLWGRTDMLKRSLGWYKCQLENAKKNASRNNYRGARWPKMTAYDGIDSPSTIATLLIWQQPHIIYMLELAYQSGESEIFLTEYWGIVKETADFMSDYAVYNSITQKYDLCGPLIPAQEEHDPKVVYNPTFELEYWAFALKIAVRWAERLGYKYDEWKKVAYNMADLPIKDGLYLAHENCPTTFQEFTRDHPSMIGSFGLIQSDRVCKEYMRNTLKKVIECWDFSTMWGWDFAMMAMTAVRLGEPEIAIDILLKNTPKNKYVVSGNNFQELRTDLPLYLPGNGALLFVIPLMVAGYKGQKAKKPGFPNNGMWEIEFEDINGYPY